MQRDLRTSVVSGLRIVVGLVLLASGGTAFAGDRPMDAGLADHWECRHMAGAAFGSFSNALSWETVGRPDVGLTASPVFSFSCDVGGGRVSAFTSMDFAPTYLHRDWARELQRQMFTASAGLTTGWEHLRLGGLLTLGDRLFAVGARTVWLPFQKRSGARHGLELRARYWVGEPLGFQLTALAIITSRRLDRLGRRRR